MLEKYKRMTTRRKTKDKKKLTPKEIATAVERMMGAAQAHQRASVWCADKPDAKPPNIDAWFFSAVSFELILLSIEQSLRLLLLLHFSINNATHDLSALHKQLRNKSRGKEGIRSDIIREINTWGQTINMGTVSENDLVTCLKKHNSSYSNFRYFQLDDQGRLNKKWEFSHLDRQTLHCFALALISLNMKEIERRGFKVMASMSPVPESEMTEDLKALREKMISR